MKTITVENTINTDLETVWEFWTSPEHITKWNFASPDWHCPRAEHELKVGGKLKYHMEAKDGSMAFDYEGTFTQITRLEHLEYALEDGRKVAIVFQAENGKTIVTQTFEVEDENSIELQKQGWEAILNNFKKYSESQ